MVEQSILRKAADEHLKRLRLDREAEKRQWDRWFKTGAIFGVQVHFILGENHNVIQEALKNPRIFCLERYSTPTTDYFIGEDASDLVKRLPLVADNIWTYAIHGDDEEPSVHLPSVRAYLPKRAKVAGQVPRIERLLRDAGIDPIFVAGNVRIYYSEHL